MNKKEYLIGIFKEYEGYERAEELAEAVIYIEEIKDEKVNIVLEFLINHNNQYNRTVRTLVNQLQESKIKRQSLYETLLFMCFSLGFIVILIASIYLYKTF